MFVVPAGFGWDDLGAWNALERLLDHENDGDRGEETESHGAESPTDSDRGGNAILGDALTIDASGNVVATDGHVSLVGVEDLIVASFDDRTLVAPKDDAQRVREVVAELRERDLF